MTPTCTVEACNLRDNYSALIKAGMEVIGISPDDEKSHIKFIEKQELPYQLLADEKHEVLEKYGVWGEKSMYGRKYMGVLRTTFLINETGKIAHIIDKLLRRHWQIFDSNGTHREVEGEGVVGQQPILEPGESFQYMSGVSIRTEMGRMMGKYQMENIEPVKFAEISPNVFDALVATEDERFYEHSGVDAEAIGRALFGVVTFNPSGGASTITQQLAKALLDQGSGNIFARLREKLKEQIVAVKLEKNLTKQEILTLYLNTVPWGYNSFGIKSAAK
ncbi:unnamed protein product, partial [Darwinula stevensoni]